jgi:hypothetical protein
LDPKVQKKCKKAKVLHFLFLFPLDPNRPLAGFRYPTRYNCKLPFDKWRDISKVIALGLIEVQIPFGTKEKWRNFRRFLVPIGILPMKLFGTKD